MSNLSELVDNLNRLGSGQTTAIRLAGSVMGTIADASVVGWWSGGLTAVIGVLGLVQQQNDELAQELGKLTDLIEQILGHDRAQNDLERLHNFDEPVTNAQSMIQSLPDWVQAQPPLSQDFRAEHVRMCLAAVDQISLPDQWLTNYYDELYYYDDRLGSIGPEPNADGTAWTTRFTLPEFLRALNVYITVTQSLEGSLSDNAKELLRGFAATLHDVHDRAAAGIAPLPAPSVAELWSSNLTDYLTDGEGFLVSAWSCGVTLESFLGLPGFFDPNGGIQWYGAVDRYTGLNSLGSYPGLRRPPGLPPPTKQFVDQFYVKLGLANLKRWKDVYVGLGLPTVWTTVNQLAALTGNPPLRGHDASGWSLRELRRTLGAVHIPSSITWGISTAMVLGTMAELRGLDPDARPLSMRDQLNALPYPDAGIAPI
jgi:hypothetical protein